MRVEKFVADEKFKLSDFIFDKLPEISYNKFQKILRSKDIKVNGVRCSKDIYIYSGDEIEIYFVSEKLSDRVIYEDENIIVVNKPRGIETISEGSCQDSLLLRICKEICKCYPVHRLDRNTSGLAIFAKSLKSQKLLEEAFKNRNIDKYYLALVYGKFNVKEDLLKGYLKKDENKSFVYISDEKLSGFVEIKTKYKVIEEYENTSLLEVELLTGKTHQIRAHFAHIGHFLIGDEKYGNSSINKNFKKRYQCLTSYKIKFNFNNDNELCYLNEKEILLPREKIDFLSNNK